MKHLDHILRAGAMALLAIPMSLHGEAPAYKADISFGKKDMTAPPLALAIDEKDGLFVLLDNGTILAYNTAGEKTGGFKADIKAPTTLAAAAGKIYVLQPKKETKEVVVRGKKLKREVPAGLACVVFDTAGAKQREIALPEAAAATDAHFIGAELAVADNDKDQVVFYDISGDAAKVTRKITKGFRLCCGIFDINPGKEPGTVLAANLGAFKVQLFKDGEKTSEFGKRGNELQDFTGCCNPVNVASLPDGSILTVEKSPTRVKIFDKENKTCARVTGLTELVEGCSTIPVVVDSKGSVFLLSDTQRCVVKCVPGVSDKPEPEPAKDDEPAADDPAWMKDLMEKVIPLIEDEKFDEAVVASDALIKAHPEMTQDEKARVTLHARLEMLTSKGDAEAACKALDDIMATYPESELKEQADEIKGHIRQRIDTKQADAVLEKLEPLLEKETDKEKLRTEAEALLKDKPQMSQNARAIVFFRVLVEPLVEAGDEKGALGELEALAKAYPESDFAKDAESFKTDMLERIEGAKVESVMTQLAPMVDAEEYDKAAAAAEKHFAEHPELSQSVKSMVMFQLVVMPLVEGGEAEAAVKELETLVKKYPESRLAKEADQIRESIKGSVEVEEMEEEEAVEKENTGEKPAAAPEEK